MKIVAYFYIFNPQTKHVTDDLDRKDVLISAFV